MSTDKIKILFDMPNDRANYIIYRGFSDALSSLDHTHVIHTKIEGRTEELKKQLQTGPDIIFTPTRRLPVFYSFGIPEETSIILHAEPFQRIPDSIDSVSIGDDCVSSLDIIADRNIVAISEFNIPVIEEFFSPYVTRWDIPVLPVPHAANSVWSGHKRYRQCVDIGFIGSIYHRKSNYAEKYLIPAVRNTQSQMLIIPDGDRLGFDKRKISPRLLIRFSDLIYSSIRINISIHSAAQSSRKLSIQESVFTRALSCGFQICDNPLLQEYFSSDEIPVYPDPDEYLTAVQTFLHNPEKRFSFIERAYYRALAEHTYFHRLKTIFSKLNYPDISSEIESKIETLRNRKFPEISSHLQPIQKLLLRNLGKSYIKAVTDRIKNKAT